MGLPLAQQELRLVPEFGSVTNGASVQFALSNDFTMPSTANDASINSNLDYPVGTAPRPSSGHPDIVIIGWADGGASSISQSIDGMIYARMLTPSGTIAGQSVDSLDFRD